MKIRAGEVVSTINVTPLVDVCLVLLIIFMIVVPMIPTGAVSLPASSTATTQQEEDGTITLTLHTDGTVFFGPLAIRLEQLPGELERTFAATPSRRIVVRAEKSLRYGEVMKVLRDCRDSGFQEVGLATSPRVADDESEGLSPHAAA